MTRETLSRRSLLATGLAAGVGAGTAVAATSRTHAGARTLVPDRAIVPISLATLEPNAAHDQTTALQTMIDAAAARGEPLQLPPGRIRTGTLRLRPGTHLIGAHGQTTLDLAAGAALTAENANGIAVEALVVDGGRRPATGSGTSALVAFSDCTALSLRRLTVTGSTASGIALERCSGRVADCTVTHAAVAGIFSRDATGLEILHNTVTDCSNNGIQVWRAEAGEDGTIISANRVERIAAAAGGTGQNGNGVNVFRAGGVIVSGNRIADCAYSAIRGNAASDIQMVANSCSGIGEVALYAEFGFEGALISSNVIDGAASGVAVTNFNEGGRLAVVQGNLVRNLHRRELEPEDKRGIGISVEADSVVSGNTIEGAQTAGIMAGWGRYRRDIVVSLNLVRASAAGILVADSVWGGGPVLVSANMISGCPGGGIRAMDGDGAPSGPELENGMTGRITTHGNVVA